MSPLKLLPLFSAALAAAILVSGCSKGSFNQPVGQGQPGVFRYAIATNPTSLDPAIVQDIDTGGLIQNVYEPLVTYDEHNEIAPLLAESWKVENGGRTYVFKIRADAKFHNGRAVTSEDFKWTFERNLDPKLNSPTAAGYLADIVGVADRVAGKTTTVSGIETPDPQTLKITIDQPRAYFLGKLTYPCAYVLAKEAIKGKEIHDLSECIGTGPYKFEKFVPEQEVDLVANKDYYLGAPSIERIMRPVIKDAATRLNKYRNGEADLLTLERQDLAAAAADPKLKADLHVVPRPAIYYIGLNQIKYPPFKDVRVRRAFIMAIDRTKIAKELVGLPEAKGFIAPGIKGYREDLAGTPFDPAGAKKLLAEAGYPGGKGLPPLTISYRDGRPDSETLAVAAVTDLRENLGFSVDAKKMEWRSMLEARNKAALPFYGASWYADYLDPQNFLSFLLASTADQNHDGYSNPEFDRLCAEADTSLDEAKREELYHQAEDLLIKDAARIPVYFGQDNILISPRVEGVRTNLFGQMPDTTVKIKG